VLGRPGSDRGCRHPADEQAQRSTCNVGKAQVVNEGGADRQRQEKLDRIDRPDDLARIGPLDQQVGSHDRAPAATAGSIQESANQTQRRDQLGLAHARRIHQAAPQQVKTDTREVGQHERLDHIGMERGQHIGSGHAANDPGDEQADEQLAVDIAVQQVADSGRRRGKALNQMDPLRGLRRGHAQHPDQQGVRDNAKGHAKRAIDQLRRKAHRNEREQVGEVDCAKIHDRLLRGLCRSKN